MIRLLLSLWRLLIPFIALMIGWGFVTDAILKLLDLQRPVLVNAWSTMGFGLLLVALFVTGVLVAWNLAALVYRLTRGTPAVTV